MFGFKDKVSLIVSWSGATAIWIVFMGLPILWRQIKLAIASAELEGDQADFLRQLEHRLSPYSEDPGDGNLHELYREARDLEISPWRLRLLK